MRFAAWADLFEWLGQHTCEPASGVPGEVWSLALSVNADIHDLEEEDSEATDTLIREVVTEAGYIKDGEVHVTYRKGDSNP